MTADPVQLRTRRIWALTVMFCVAVIVLTADAISKQQVLARLSGHPPVRLLHGVIAYIIRIARRLRSLAWTIAFGLLLGGAMGNLGDRLFRGPGPFRGQVVDWLNLPHFPWTFNLADASISCAAVLIAVLALRGVRIDGTSPAHAADRIDTDPSTPSVAPAPRDGTTRLVDSDECAS
jgi:lipoprotein signal peptidase